MTKSDHKSQQGLSQSNKESMVVLLVDGERSSLNVTKQILEMGDLFRVDTASSVEEALEKMKKKAFDVIISGHVMPGKDGLQFLRELRDNGNDIPFILFTVLKEEVETEALSLGAYRCLGKVGDPEIVYTELKRAIRQATRGIEKESVGRS
jgi:CheY-like chemotaxis protein